MSRKTVEVAYVLERGNYFLANSEDSQKDERKGVASMIELVLFQTGNYKGFGYLESAGINHDAWQAAWDKHRAVAEILKANGITGWNNNQPRWDDYCKDDTRRIYYMANELF